MSTFSEIKYQEKSTIHIYDEAIKYYNTMIKECSNNLNILKIIEELFPNEFESFRFKRIPRGRFILQNNFEIFCREKSVCLCNDGGLVCCIGSENFINLDFFILEHSIGYTNINNYSIFSSCKNWDTLESEIEDYIIDKLKCGYYRLDKSSYISISLQEKINLIQNFK